MNGSVEDMERQRIVRAFFIVCMLLMLSMNLAVAEEIKGEEIKIEDKVYHKEVTVAHERDFIVRLEGSGWYLNRYDRKSLSFKLRRIEPDATYFTMHALNKGDSYMLFTYKEKDVYILVKISSSVPLTHKSISDSSDAVRLIVNVEEEEESAKEKKELPDSGKDGDRPSSKTAEIEITQKEMREEPIETEKKSEDKEIYYTDKKGKVVKVPDSSEDDHYFDALRSLKNQSYDRSLDGFEHYLAHCKKCRYRDEAYLKIADLYTRLGRTEQAVNYFERLFDSPSHQYRKEAHTRKAELSFNAGNLLDALNDYEKAHEYDPRDIDVLRMIGDICYDLQRHEDALQAYERLIAQGHYEDGILFRVASMYDSPGEMRDVEKAYKYYRKIVEMYSASKHYAYSVERVQFFERHFFQYK